MLQVKVLVDTVVGDAKYSMKYITAPALMMIAGNKPKEGRTRAMPEDPTAAKRRYPHIGRLVEAFISPLLATVGALIIPIHGLYHVHVSHTLPSLFLLD
jgi:hypothetical protein